MVWFLKILWLWYDSLKCVYCLQTAETAGQAQHCTGILRCCAKWHWFLLVSFWNYLCTREHTQSHSFFLFSSLLSKVIQGGTGPRKILRYNYSKLFQAIPFLLLNLQCQSTEWNSKVTNLTSQNDPMAAFFFIYWRSVRRMTCTYADLQVVFGLPLCLEPSSSYSMRFVTQ